MTGTGGWEAERQVGCRAQPSPFSTAYHKRLEDDLSSDTSGHFKRILVSLALVRVAVSLGMVPSLLQAVVGGLQGCDDGEDITQLGSAAGPCLPSPHLGLSWEMSSLQLHKFFIELQGNRDEGPENLTQAHEDAKVRTILAVLLQVVCHKNEDVASPGLEMASSGKQIMLGWGLKLQVEMPGERMPLEVKLPHPISDTLGSTALYTWKLQTRRAAQGAPSPRGCSIFSAELLIWGTATHSNVEIWHLSFKGSFGLVCRSHPPFVLCKGQP